MSERVKFFKVSALPGDLVSNTLYFVQSAVNQPITLYVTSNTSPVVASPVGQVVDVQDAIAALLQAGAGITLEQDPDTGTITINSTPGSWVGTAEMIGIGDSIMRGYLAGDNAGSWLNKLAALRGCSVINGGVDGSTVAVGGTDPMVSRYPTLVPLGFGGHVFDMGGANDFDQNLPLGVPGSTDTSTIYGASLVMGRGTLNRGPCFYHVCTPLWRGDYAEGTRRGTGFTYTMEMVRQAKRDVAAQLMREFPGRVELIETGRDLAPWLSGPGGFMNSDNLHPTGSGDTLIAQYVDMRATGASGTVLPPPTPNYSRTFADLSAGNLSGREGWIVYGESGTVTASGLEVAAPFDTQPRGILHALPEGVTRVAMRFTTANFLASPGNGVMLRAFHRLSDNRAICIWVYKAAANPTARLDAGILQGTNVTTTFIGANGPDIPSNDVWVEVQRGGGQMELRMWDAGSGVRPASATATVADDPMVADAFGISTIGSGTRLVKSISAQ
ncbi:hypothetical protein [Deinococcus hopiensis]|uniref:Uncharacterized protein n=1 Tax=Deinococcus hopiensis KR-140 TaxID=695939 RepID=A0A1W1UXF7_9DEIO|nr:hypothetical protein [Deinococcus hopiensis]SMB85762.1 hypothetical protein SAMN00790413_03530 [Deinococcus hopiensis KR-140]